MPLGLGDSDLAFSDDAATETTTGGYAHDPQDRHAGRTKRFLKHQQSLEQTMGEENVESEGRPPYLHVRYKRRSSMEECERLML
jgi:hypothetical protein